MLRLKCLQIPSPCHIALPFYSLTTAIGERAQPRSSCHHCRHSKPNQLMSKHTLTVVGGRYVGKAALIRQFFIQLPIVTEYDCAMEDVQVRCVIDDENAYLDIVEPGEYRAMWEAFVGYGDGFLLIYSITSRSSFEEIPALLQEILRVKRKDFVPTILVANKCDLEHERQVSTDEGQEMAKQLGARLIETSATQMINVGEPFYDLVREIRRFRKDTYNSHDQSSNQLDNKENKGCCCRIM